MNEITHEVNFVLFYILGFSVVLLIGVTVTMLYFVFKYSKKKNPVPASHIKDHLALEITWTILPTILVLSMFYFGLKGYKVIRNIPENPDEEIIVIGQMWEWKFEYDNKKTSKILYLPLDEKVKFIIKSNDVLHSFFVPAYRIKQDCVPGMDTYLWYQPNKTGTFDVFCAEYCGLQHANMITTIEVLPVDEFEKWKAEIPVDVTEEITIEPEEEETESFLSRYGD